MTRSIRLVIAIAALVAFAGQAQASDFSKLTREQVRSEYFAARDAGRLPATGEVGQVMKTASSPSQLSRAAVVQALLRDGPIPSGEGSGSVIAAREAAAFKSTTNRDAVRAEFEHAMKDGTLPPNGEVGATIQVETHSLADHAAGRVH